MRTPDVETFDEAYRCARLPEHDRAGWVQVLLRYPLDREHQRRFPSADDESAAITALRADNQEPSHDRVHTLAWQQCVAQEGERLLGVRDVSEIAAYLRQGGSLVEATGYLDAVDGASSPTDDLWTVWARFEVCFSATRFGLYRRLSVSPSDLAAFVGAGWFTRAWDVEQVHRWGQQVCPDAPFAVAAAYRGYGLTDDEVPDWEARRQAGDDVVAALTMLTALTPQA